MKKNPTRKHYVAKKRSPALVPVPGSLDLLLELANLLPAQFRNPYWARREEKNRQGSKYVSYEREILDWQFGTESAFAKIARWIEKPVSDEWSVNSPQLLWVMLQAMLSELPIPLQAFVLHDEQGNEVEFEGEVGKHEIHPDLQSLRNLLIIEKSEHELKRVVQEASDRIDKSIEDEASGNRLSQIPDFDYSVGLLERARQRLILVLGLQELFSYLMHPEKRNDFLFADIYYQSDAARSHFYTDNNGKIRFTPPRIVGFLEGIEALRIKECPICFKFFWAGRRDMRCCSTQCANALRMREYRKRYYVK